MSQPTGNLPDWSTDDTNNTEPSAGLKLTGWPDDDIPTARNFNWLFWQVSRWLTYLKNLQSEVLTWTAAQTFSALLTATAAIIVTRATAGIGLTSTGNGAFSGLKGIGGATGAGVEGVGGATSGVGVQGTGGPNSAGVRGDGTGTGQGLFGVGGASDGSGVTGLGGGTAGLGINGQGAGTGAGSQGTGGATGHGGNFIGGATSGDGVRGTATTLGSGGTFTGAGARPGVDAIKGAGVTYASRGNGNHNITAAAPAKTDVLANGELHTAHTAVAWGVVNLSGGAVADYEGVGITSVSLTGGAVRVTINRSPVTDLDVGATYFASGAGQFAYVQMVSATVFDIFAYDSTGAGAGIGFGASTHRVSFRVFAKLA